jgi:arginase
MSRSKKAAAPVAAPSSSSSSSSSTAPAARSIEVIGFPMDLGAGRRGVDMGPTAFRIAGLVGRMERLGFKVKDLGDIDIPIPEVLKVGDESARYLAETVKACKRLALRVTQALGKGKLPLVLGGDHSSAIGTIAGVAAHFRARDQETGVVWIDAHGDLNTPETSPTGNIHGMPLAASLGFGPEALVELGGFSPKVKPGHVALVGIRDLDPGERKLIAETGITVFTMKEVDRLGIARATEEAIAIAARANGGLHVSFDMDVLDPSAAPGVGTPVRGGLNYREAHLAMEIIADSRRLTSLEIVEANPILDTRNATAELGTELVMSALGKRIL